MAPRGPRLETDRPGVVLEAWGREHKDGLLAAADDERIARFMTDQFPHPNTDQDADEWLALCQAQEPPLSLSTVADGYRKDGELIDRLQYWLARRDWSVE